MDGNFKIKLLVIGIYMNSAGTEKSFISFANCIDYDKYDVDLLLAKKEGTLLDMIPKQVNVIEMEEYGDFFLMSGKNAMKTMTDCFVKKNPLALLQILPYFLKIIFNPAKKAFTATRMWRDFMRRYMKPYDKKYDIAVSYWGDRTMFYMVDKVTADKKITWLHFDYGNPPREDKLYLEYFSKCDKIVNVSETVDKALKDKLPEIADRCVVIENINDPKQIWDMGLRGDSFPDKHFKGKRLLSVIRIAKQKGIDMIPEVMAKLSKDGYDLRWYILGDGEIGDKQKFINELLAYEVADRVILLGTTTNPYSYLRDADIYVQPSLYEGKPITVEEAKIMYKPIVATNYLSANEQLDGGRFGLITDISAEGLYKGIKRLLDDEKLCDEFTMTLSKENFGNTYEMEKFYKM